MQARRVIVASLVTVVLVAGCGDDDTKVDTATTTTTLASSTTTGGSDTSAVSSTTAVATTAAPPIETGVVLAADGLTIVPFGASTDNVVEALSDALGAPTADDAVECPSGADRAVRFGNLLTIHSGGFLVGWTLGKAPAGAPTHDLRTVEGLGLGASEDEVRATYPDVTIEETSLGTEFHAELTRGFYGGLLSADTSVVEAIFAGDACAFR